MENKLEGIAVIIKIFGLTCGWGDTKCQIFLLKKGNLIIFLTWAYIRQFRKCSEVYCKNVTDYEIGKAPREPSAQDS